MSGRRERQRGVALVTVLWVSTLLALLVAGFTAAVRTDARLAVNAVEEAQAQAMLETGLARAVLGLLAGETERRWRADARPYHVSVDSGEIRVTIQDENGRIDLNKADDRVLSGLFESAGVPEEEVSGYLDAVLDWRDEDDLRRLNGAEDDDYADAGLDYGAGDGPFLVAAQLQQVLGVGPRLHAALAERVTTLGRDGAINPLTAPAAVLRALPDVVEADVEEVLRLRREPPEQAGEAVLARLSFIGDLLRLEAGPYYALALQAQTKGGFRAAAEVVVWIDPEQADYRIVEWREARWRDEAEEVRDE